jgi:phosphoadenosine phosphosulfate reductase
MVNNVNKAIKILQNNEPEGGYKLSFSGGKDSVVIYSLAEKADVEFYPEFFNTTIEFQETYRFIRKYYPAVKWLSPVKTFWQGMVMKGLPHRKARWCCDLLKKCHSKNDNVYIIGIRADESRLRTQRYTSVIETCHTKNISKVYPILDWTENEIWEYIKQNSLPVNPLYLQGYKRIGCIACPLAPANMKRDIENNTHFYKMLHKTIIEYLNLTKSKLVSKGKHAGSLNFFHRNNMNVDEVIAWYIGDMKIINNEKWYKKEQLRLF